MTSEGELAWGEKFSDRGAGRDENMWQRKAAEEVTAEVADRDSDRAISSATVAKGRAISSRIASQRSLVFADQAISFAPFK